MRCTKIPYIQTRNFGNEELIKTEKGKTFHPDYVEITDPRVLERIANRRTESEKQLVTISGDIDVIECQTEAEMRQNCICW